jgi:hypothetical protein
MNFQTLTFEPQLQSLANVDRAATRRWLIWFGVLIGLTALIGAMLLPGEPSPAAIGWVLYALALIAIIYEPRYGVYLMIFLSLYGDILIAPWYPFNKNFSSRESLFFVNKALIFSPLEVMLVVTLLAWLIGGWMRRKIDFVTGPIFKPLMLYAGFIVFGLLYGLGRRGNVNIALWEARPIFYLFAIVILASNLLRKREHLNHALWAAMLGIFFESFAGISHLLIDLKGSLAGVEAIGEHSMSIHENTLFIFLIAAWLYRASPTKRLGLLAMAPTVLWTYAANQRRASYIGLVIALALIFLVLFKVNRKMFWFIMPPLAAAGVLYTIIFWNASGPIAQPARAIRSVIAPVKDGRDDRSNVYRVIENLNTDYTIHRQTLTGVGFGQKFLVVVPLPDISFFIWWEYITHNSIMWIWMKSGIGGFFAMVFLVGYALFIGARALWRVPRGDLSAIVLTANLYIVMHFIYAYVDMSWDTQSMLYIGLALGIINTVERIVAMPLPPPRKRWHWQPEPQPIPGLLPLPQGVE